ncbi:MAG: PAS domain-containing protein [Lentisphaerota bacterium]
MEFYREKYIELRKQKKIKLTVLARKLNLSRITLWHWDKGTRIPSEKQAREIAKALGVSVDLFSNLQREAPVSEKGMVEEGKALNKWISFDEQEHSNRKKQQSSLLADIAKQFEEASLSVKIMRTLLNYGEVMLYVKDSSHRYIAASKEFLNLVSMPSEMSVYGQTDLKLFPVRDAKENLDEDEKVILTGERVKNREGYIPGSRKLRWGIISKIPTYDVEGKITGLVGSFIDITRRKNAEHIADILKKGLDLLNNQIIFMGTGRDDFDESNSLIPKDVLYISNNDLTKRFYAVKPDASLKELARFLASLKIEKPMHDLKALEEKGYSRIHYKIKAPDNEHETLNISSTIYYDKDADLYFGFLEIDKLRNIMDKITSILRERKVDESIIQEILAQKFDS